MRVTSATGFCMLNLRHRSSTVDEPLLNNYASLNIGSTLILDPTMRCESGLPLNWALPSATSRSGSRIG